MQIFFKTTSEISEQEWISYTSSFNTVFNKHATSNDFKHKYLKTIDNNSYHSLLIVNDEIVGGFSIIPYEYFINKEKVKIGLAVDVFILKEHRNNPMSLYMMYKTLKKKIVDVNIEMVAGVPNDMAYPFWKKVLGWKDIGCIPYYALPVKMGNVVSIAKPILNILNAMFLKFWFLNFSNFKQPEKLLPIRIDKENSLIEEQRYTHIHHKIMHAGIFFSYRIVDENGIMTCYLIDFYKTENKHKNRSVLKKAIKNILKSEKIDIIVFVGTLSFRSRFLIKIPFNKEPKHLYFTGDILSTDKIKEEIVFNLSNWDFGLFNYDVR